MHATWIGRLKEILEITNIKRFSDMSLPKARAGAPMQCYDNRRRGCIFLNVIRLNTSAHLRYKRYIWHTPRYEKSLNIWKSNPS